jgi:hypothetical protein
MINFRNYKEISKNQTEQVQYLTEENEKLKLTIKDLEDKLEILKINESKSPIQRMTETLSRKNTPISPPNKEYFERSNSHVNINSTFNSSKPENVTRRHSCAKHFKNKSELINLSKTVNCSNIILSEKFIKLREAIESLQIKWDKLKKFPILADYRGLIRKSLLTVNGIILDLENEINHLKSQSEGTKNVNLLIKEILQNIFDVSSN